ACVPSSSFRPSLVITRSMFSFLLIIHVSPIFFFFFFNDTATTEIYTLSLHDALPIYLFITRARATFAAPVTGVKRKRGWGQSLRSEEHTSELQSLTNLVCRLLLEKKKTKRTSKYNAIATNAHVHTRQLETTIVNCTLP